MDAVAASAAQRAVGSAGIPGTVRPAGGRRAGTRAPGHVARLALAGAGAIAAYPVHALPGGAFVVAAAGGALGLDEGGRDRAWSSDVRDQVASGAHLRGHVDEIVRELCELVPRRRSDGARRGLAVVDRSRAGQGAVGARARRHGELVDGEARGEGLIGADVR